MRRREQCAIGEYFMAIHWMFPVRIVQEEKKLFLEGRSLVRNLVVRRVTIITKRAFNIPKDYTTVGTAYSSNRFASDIKVWHLLMLRKEENVSECSL